MCEHLGVLCRRATVFSHCVFQEQRESRIVVLQLRTNSKSAWTLKASLVLLHSASDSVPDGSADGITNDFVPDAMRIWIHVFRSRSDK